MVLYGTVFEGQVLAGMLMSLLGTEILQGQWTAQGPEKSGKRFDFQGLGWQNLILGQSYDLPQG
jgi:hypothetical protein